MTPLRLLLFAALLISACSRTSPSPADTAPVQAPTAAAAELFDDYEDPMWGLYTAAVVDNPRTACKELIGELHPCVCGHGNESGCECPSRGPLNLSLCLRGRGEASGTPVFAVFEHKGTWFSMPLAQASAEHEVGSGLGFSDGVDDFKVEQVTEHSALVSIHYSLMAQGETCFEEDGEEHCGTQVMFSCKARAAAVIGLGASPPRMMAIEDQLWHCTPGEEVSAREAAASEFGDYFKLPTIERELRLTDDGLTLLIDGERLELSKGLYLFERRPHVDYRHILEYGEAGRPVDF